MHSCRIEDGLVRRALDKCDQVQLQHHPGGTSQAASFLTLSINANCKLLEITSAPVQDSLNLVIVDISKFY